MSEKMKNGTNVRRVEKTNPDTGAKYYVTQKLVEVRAPQTVTSVRGAVHLLKQICKVVYPLGNSWLQEIVETDDWGALSAQFEQLMERAPRDENAAPLIAVGEDRLAYGTASLTACLDIECLPWGEYAVKALVWQAEATIWPMARSVKKIGLVATW